MIITKTPLRVSFLGGGTDYPAYFLRHGGATLATSINKFTYITVNRLTPFFDHKVGVHYSRVELVGDPGELQHPSVRECLGHMTIKDGIEIHVMADLPARTGLGSSSCFTVGLLHALHCMQGKLVSKFDLAKQAIYVEQNLIKERVGSQDQVACAVGGLNLIRFETNGAIEIHPIPMGADRLKSLQGNLMLFYTGLQRSAHEIIEQQLTKTTAGDLDANLAQMRSLVDHGVNVLAGSGNLDAFGDLLDQGWMLKRSCSTRISTGQIDHWYAQAKAAGALGGKLLGAGGGGFLLLYVPLGKQDRVRHALADLREVPFAFENSGTSCVFYQPSETNL